MQKRWESEKVRRCELFHTIEANEVTLENETESVAGVLNIVYDRMQHSDVWPVCLSESVLFIFILNT